MSLMPAMPLMSLLFMVIFTISVASFSRAYLFAIMVVAALLASLILAVKGRYLPRWIMDILDRLSDKTSLEKAYEQRNGRNRPVVDAQELAALLKSKVIGQDVAIDQISVHLRRRLAAQRSDKPVAVFCLAGPPGVGKTHLAKVLAEHLYGDKSHLHFFDMSQFGQPHAAASLFGQARGYVGSTSYGALTAALRDVPECVVLLDEFEKAHPEVHKRFLTAWNDGFVTETSDGARVPTNGAIFILTTNAASRRIGEIAQSHDASSIEADRLIKKALSDAQFAPEVLSRIDRTFAFRPLAGLDVARVVALELEVLAKQFGLVIADGGIDAAILMRAIQRLEKQMDGGVRDVARSIERDVTDGLIEARAQGAETVRIADRDGAVVVDIIRRTGEPRAGAVARPARAAQPGTPAREP